MDLGTIRDVAVAAAARAGEILYSHWGGIHNVEKKGAINLVTEADVASEKAIIEVIRTAFPDHTILVQNCHPVRVDVETGPLFTHIVGNYEIEVFIRKFF